MYWYKHTFLMRRANDEAGSDGERRGTSYTLGQASKGAVHASINADAVMPELGSHAVRALTPSVVSTKQSTQQLEFLDGHIEKQLVLRFSIAA